MERKSVFLTVGAVAVAALLVVAAFVIISDDDKNTDALPFETSSSDWNYWLGNLDMPGVSDAKTPITEAGFNELWKVTAAVDGGSMNWKVPGSAICVGNYTYYYHGDEGRLKCVDTRTGELIREADCPSDAVYNMAIAYGDGKIFVPCRISGNVQVAAFDAGTLDKLFVTENVSGLEVQGPVVYHDGRIFFGTYSGDFACFPTQDADTSRSDEVVPVSWKIKADGWYNATPAFAGRFCVVAEKGYAIGGMIIYVVDYKTGAIYDSYKINGEYCTSGFILDHKDGRIYTAASKAPSGATEETSDKRLVVRSFKITAGGSVDAASFKTWESDVTNGGTQSTPIIYNDRLYIGGGGGTLGSDEPFHVLSIAADGTMTEAYRADTVKTKGTAAITNAYATAANGNEVYIYLMQYDTPGTIFVLRDKAGQDSAGIVFEFTPSVSQYSFQSFSISPDGCLLIRNDSTLFCFGSAGTAYRGMNLSAGDTKTGGHGPEDVSNGIYRILAFCEGGHVNPLELERLEERFAMLSESDKGSVENYQDLQSVYYKVSVVMDGKSIELKVPHGSLINMPSIEDAEGKIITGWSATPDGSREWMLWSDKVTGDLTLYAVYGDTVKLTFDSDGGSAIDCGYAIKGDKMGYLPVPVRDGYVFDGWYAGGVLIKQGGTVPTDDAVLKAQWLKISTISFDSNGGSSVSPATAVYSRPLGDLPTPSRDGYTFDGWYLGSVRYETGTIWGLEADAVLTARWTENPKKTIDVGGVEVKSELSDDSTASMTSLNPNSSTARKLKDAAGPDAETRMIAIRGTGISADQDYELTIKVNPAWEGLTCTVYYIYEGNVLSASGKAVSGAFTVTVKGAKTSNGAEIAIATANGMLRVEAGSVVVSQSSANLELYRSLTLSAMVYPAEAGQTVIWSSSDDSIATVDPNGKIIALKTGTVTIRATAANGKYAECVITISDNNSRYLSFQGSPNMTSTVSPDAGSVDLGILLQNNSAFSVSWQSDNNNVATVDPNGVVTIIGTGTAVIKAMLSIDGTRYATCTIHVVGDTAVMVHVNNGADGWQTEVGSGADAYLALSGTGFAAGSIIAGSYTEGLSSADYGTITKLLGLENSAGNKWHVFVYIKSGAGFEWAVGLDAIGFYRPFSDYSAEYATANIALFYGTPSAAEAELAVLNSDEKFTTVALTEASGALFRFSFQVWIPDYMEIPDGFEMDDELGLYVKTFEGYGSDLYRALLNAFGGDISGNMHSLGFLGFADGNLSGLWDFTGDGSTTFIELMTLDGFPLDLPLGSFGPASPIGSNGTEFVLAIY